MSSSQTGHECYLGLGSNLNNPCRQITKAIQHISRIPGTDIIKTAPWYLSKAWGVIDQNDFVNTVAMVNTSLTPMALLKALKNIEYRLMQRQKNKKWHARIIDIDILIYGRVQLNRPQLTIPHPHLAQRCFVVEPLLSLQPKLTNQLKKDLIQHKKGHDCHQSLRALRTPNST